MALEIPEFSTCCLCFPLLPGLLAWGCFKIIAYVLIIPVVGYFLLIAYGMTYFGIGDDIYLIWILCSVIILIILILLITDFVVTMVFICDGHEENVKLIKGYYKYNIGVLIVMILLIVAALAIAVAHLVLAYIAIVVMQAYFTLLLRSQVIKLESAGEFVNNSAEV